MTKLSKNNKKKEKIILNSNCKPVQDEKTLKKMPKNNKK